MRRVWYIKLPIYIVPKNSLWGRSKKRIQLRGWCDGSWVKLSRQMVVCQNRSAEHKPVHPRNQENFRLFDRINSVRRQKVVATAVVLKVNCQAADEALVVGGMALSGTMRENKTKRSVRPRVGSGPAPIIYKVLRLKVTPYPAELTMRRKITTVFIDSPIVGCCIFYRTRIN